MSSEKAGLSSIQELPEAAVGMWSVPPLLQKISGLRRCSNGRRRNGSPNESASFNKRKDLNNRGLQRRNVDQLTRITGTERWVIALISYL